MRRLLGVVLLCTLTLLGIAHPAAAEETALTDSWPREGVTLWVPPREGHLEFSAKVLSSSLALELRTADGDAVANRTLERLTSEQYAEKVIFRIPGLGAGEYRIVWSVETETGAKLDGEIGFTVDEPLVAGGGQNHRHGENAHLYKDSAGEFTLRLIGLLPLILLAAAFQRSRRRGGPSRLDRFTVRLGGVLVVLVGVVQAIADVVAYVDEYHDYPLSAALAAPAVGVLPVALLAGGLCVALAPTTGRLLGVVALMVAVNAGLGHLTAGWWAVLLYLLFVTLMGGFVMLGAGLLTALADSFRGRRDETRRSVRGVAAAWLLSGLASVGMLLLHAKGFTLKQDFAADLLFRASVTGISLGLLVVGGFLMTRKFLVLRLLSLLPAVLLLGLTAALLWMPPPAAGL
jgi:methionine-rich copper-binding protein CopC